MCQVDRRKNCPYANEVGSLGRGIIMYVFYNSNPKGKQVGDCVIRAISKATNEDWDGVYTGVSLEGYVLKDMPSSNSVWGAYLKDRGFKRHIIPNTCPNCYSVRDFCRDNPRGTYILCLDGHTVCVVDGRYYDIWDSGDQTVLYYWSKEG